MIRFAIHPGIVTTHDGEVIDWSYEELIAAYNVDPDECALASTVVDNPAKRQTFIHLKPREDNIYSDMGNWSKLGADEEHKWGADFDGKKRHTMETDFDALYEEQNSEEKP